MFQFVCSVSRIPLFGEFTCQNAVMAERFIEAGSAYVSKSILTLDCSSINPSYLPCDVIQNYKALESSLIHRKDQYTD